MSAKHSSRGRVLLTDDNGVNRRVTGLVLAKAGYEVVEARDGEEAVRKFQYEHIDIVLLDIHMPRMNGYEAAQMIRSLEEAGEHVPILAMTASSMSEEISRIHEAGMDGYVSKPARAASLLAAIEAWVGRPLDEPRTATASGQVADADNEQLPVLAMGALNELRSFGGDEAEQVVQELGVMFVEGAEKQLEAITEAIRGGDTDTLKKSAHALKGSSGTLGAKRLERFCRDIEDSLYEGDSTPDDATVERLAAEIEDAREALELELEIKL